LHGSGGQGLVCPLRVQSSVLTVLKGMVTTAIVAEKELFDANPDPASSFHPYPDPDPDPLF